MSTSTIRRPRAIGYVRLSDHRGDRDASTSPERQREAISSYCQAKGWELGEVVEDLNVSGSDVGLRLDREGLKRLRALYPQADHLVIPKIDRLARNVADFMRIAEEAAESGVALVSVAESLDMSTHGGRFVAQILAAFAEMEAGTIRARVIDGNAKARDLGRFLGGVPPYGYRAVPHPSGQGRALEIDPAEAAVVRRLAEQVLSGMTVYRATRSLNDAGIPSKSGQDWSVQAVRQVLTSPRIVGRRLHRGEVITGADGLPQQFDPPVLSLETWHRLAAVLEPRPRADRRVPNPSRVLSGLVHCGLCGARMNPSQTGGDGGFSYRCSTAARGRTSCRGVSVRCAPLEAFVLEQFLQAVGRLPLFRVTELSPPEPVALVETREAIDVTARAMAADDADVEALAARLADLKVRRRALEEAPAEPRVEVVQDGTFRDAWEGNTDTEHRRDLLAEALQSIQVAPGRAGRRPFAPERISLVWTPTSVSEDFGGESRGPRPSVSTWHR